MAAVATSTGIGAAELRELLDATLRELDGDEAAGPILRASGLSLRFELTDADLALRVSTSAGGEHHLLWSFADDGPAKLVLRMDSATANAYLQGAESLAIGIARGRVRCLGESRWALHFLPVLRLVCEPYRRLVRERHPELAVG